MKVYGIIIGFVLAIGSAGAQDIVRIRLGDLDKMTKQNDAVYVINFWATWCRPCTDELPAIEKVAAEYKDHNVKVLLVSMDYANAYPAQIAGFVRKHRVQLPVYWLDENNPNAIAAVIGTNWKGVIPCTLFINNKKHYRRFVQRELLLDEWESNVKAAVQ